LDGYVYVVLITAIKRTNPGLERFHNRIFVAWQVEDLQIADMHVLAEKVFLVKDSLLIQKSSAKSPKKRFQISSKSLTLNITSNFFKISKHFKKLIKKNVCCLMMAQSLEIHFQN